MSRKPKRPWHANRTKNPSFACFSDQKSSSGGKLESNGFLHIPSILMPTPLQMVRQLQQQT